MFRHLSHDLDNGRAFLALWRNWVMATGALGVIVVGSLFLPARWLPVVSFVLMVLLWTRVRFAGDNTDRTSPPPVWITPVIVAKSLLWVTLIMLALSYAWLYGPNEWVESLSPRHPYIPILVIAPVVTVMSGYAMLRGYRYSFFREVKRRMGSLAEQGHSGAVLMQEARHQVRFTFLLNLFLTVIDTAYYYFFYINVNLNSPDKFFFVWGPLVLYVVAVCYMGMRCFTIWMYYSQPSGSRAQGMSQTMLRYLIVEGEHLYLSGEDNLADGSATNQRPVLDTPAELSFSLRERMPRADAVRYFEELSHVEKAEVRFMYMSTGSMGDSNVFHYIATVHSPQALEEGPLKGKWYSMQQIHRLMTNKRLSPMLAAELDRLITITMAWKTYDRTGRRLYKIKNYKPTFRLADINNWDVDFNDSEWLRVAENNQDRPFFTVRRLWNRLLHRD